jgi:hypothetical protein
MPWSVLLPLALAALLLYVLLDVAVRFNRALARARAVDRFRAEAAAIGRPAEVRLGALAERIAAVRHGTPPAAELVADLRAATAAARQASQAAGGLVSPNPAAAVLREALVFDLGRAARALEMVEHGCALAAENRGRSSELEAQTAIKRGYLNLLHARESLAGHLADAARLQDIRPDLRRAPGA